MFKKEFSISKHNLLAKKGHKKLNKSLKKAFNKKIVGQILKKYNETLYDDKISKTKIHIYRTDENPIFVDTSGKMDLFPSL